MEFAVIETGGKQYRVKEGDTISVEKIVFEEGETLSFPVLCFFDGKEVEVGMPFLERVVEGQVVSQEKAEKVRVFRMQPKKRMQKTQGHRQQYTKIKITKISLEEGKMKNKE
jgi:large subunit ribosomal protein L21